MSRFTKAIRYGAIGGTFCGTVALVLATGAHLSDPVRPSRHTPGKMVGGDTPWSLVGIIAGAGFGFGFVVGGIIGACSYEQTYNPPVLAAPLLADQDNPASDVVVNVQPESGATALQVDVQAIDPMQAVPAVNSPSGRVSPLGKLNFLARPVTPPVQEVVAQSDISLVNEVTSPALR